MAIQYVNVGQIENDGTGDDLREAFVKVNENFSELSTLVTESTTVTNIGNGVGIYANANDYNLQFKTLVEGNAVSIVPSATEIVISVDQIVNNLTLSGNTGQKVISGVDSLEVIGESSLSTEIVNNILTIKSTFNNLSEDTAPVLGANLNAANFSIVNLNSINGTSVDGLYKVTGNNFDFGNITFEAKNIIDWITLNTNVDMGSFTQPNFVSINMGNL